MDWISVEDRLPDEDVRVLVYLNSDRSYTKIDTDRILEGKWVRWGSDVTHWMPLPTPPTVHLRKDTEADWAIRDYPIHTGEHSQ